VDDGHVQLEVEAPVAAPTALAGELERPDPQASGLDVRARVDGATVTVTIVLLRRPRVVLLEPPGGAALVPAVVRALGGAGFDVARADDPEQALAAALEPVEPAALLVMHGASAQALRQALHRTQPLLASRLVAPDERPLPRRP